MPRLNSRLDNLTRALRQGAGQDVPKVTFGSTADVVKFLEDVLHEVRTGRMDARIGHCLATIADKALKAFELAELERLKDETQRIQEQLERVKVERLSSYPRFVPPTDQTQPNSSLGENLADK